MPDPLPRSAPVFVDLTGRRRRTVRLTAVAITGALVAAAALVLVALLNAATGPAAYLPEHEPVPAPATGQRPTPGAATGAETPADRQPAGTSDRPESPAAGPPPAPVKPTSPRTSAGKGRPDAPPGRPTDLPAPPGRTR